MKEQLCSHHENCCSEITKRSRSLETREEGAGIHLCIHQEADNYVPVYIFFSGMVLTSRDV